MLVVRIPTLAQVVSYIWLASEGFSPACHADLQTKMTQKGAAREVNTILQNITWVYGKGNASLLLSIINFLSSPSPHQPCTVNPQPT